MGLAEGIGDLMTLTLERLAELERVANAKNPVSWLSVLELIAEIRRLQGEVERLSIDGPEGMKFSALEMARFWRDVTTENERLKEALEGLLKHYVDLVESGDAGFWDPEQEEPVKVARQVLGTEEKVES